MFTRSNLTALNNLASCPIDVYELVDFGSGRKLERFGNLVVDRPCPAAQELPEYSKWNSDARFDLDRNHRGKWTFQKGRPCDWRLKTEFGQMELFPTDFGHVGVFVEQQANWKWMLAHKASLGSMNILNLFAYTGGSTLAASAAGARVTHIDSAKNMVRRARTNAECSGLQNQPIRWIVEDALKFVQREAKRGNQYDGVILDPPTYGHGTSGKATWKIDDSLPQLFDSLAKIIPECRLMIFTCHSTGYTPYHMQQLAKQKMHLPNNCNIDSGSLHLKSNAGRKLDCGNFVRWCDAVKSETERKEGRAGQ